MDKIGVTKANKVLVCGNGFERKLGLNTDYYSFLKWYEKKMNFKIEDVVNIGHLHEDEADVMFWISSNKNLTKNVLKSYNIWLVYFLILKELKTTKNSVHFTDELFTHCYCMKSFQNIDKMGANWSDLEAIIENNLGSGQTNEDGILSICSALIVFYMKGDKKIRINQRVKDISFKTKNNYEQRFNEDFIKMRELIQEWLSETVLEKQALYKYYNLPDLSEYNTFKDDDYSQILNLNYIPNPLNLKHKYLNGKLNKKIIFGCGNQKLESGVAYEWFKNFQLLEFYSDSTSLRLNEEDFLGKEYHIVGTSLAKSDYYFFYTLLEENPDVILKFYWYEYIKQNEAGEYVLVNNKGELYQQIIRMLKTYEEEFYQEIISKKLLLKEIQLLPAHIPNLEVNKALDAGDEQAVFIVYDMAEKEFKEMTLNEISEKEIEYFDIVGLKE